MMDKISVIIPAYNSEKYIEQCLESVVKQKLYLNEIIIVDNNSTDNTSNIISKFAISNDKIKILVCKESGVSKARNMGLKYASGKYIAFVDSDDIVEDGYFKCLLNNIEKYDVDISICSYINVKEKNINSIVDNSTSKSIRQLTKIDILNEMFEVDSFQGFLWNKLYKNEIIKKYNICFEERITICEDFLFNCEYINKIEKGVFDDRILYKYVQREESSYNNEFNIKMMSVLEAYEKIENICKKNKFNNDEGLYFHKLKANLYLKEKIYFKRNKYENEYHKINKNVKSYLKNVCFSKRVKLKEKIKCIIKVFFIKIFIIVKTKIKE